MVVTSILFVIFEKSTGFFPLVFFELGCRIISCLFFSCVFSLHAVMGSWEQPLSSLSIEGSVRADGETFGNKNGIKQYVIAEGNGGGAGGGSGGTILLFLRALAVGDNGTLSSAGGDGSTGGSGGGGGGRIHLHWSDIPTGDLYQPIASVTGSICTGLV